MALVPAKCTQCGAQIEVDNTQESGTCQYCGRVFITEKALDYYDKVLAGSISNTEAYVDIEPTNSISGTNIGGIPVTTEIGEKIKRLIESGEVVQAIKEVRETTGLGLKEAKDAVDAYRGINTNVVRATGNTTPNTPPANNTTVNNTAANNATANNTTKSSGGCYIATCVYGSYDCPEVWTLRRFRDYTLDETWYGRLFIKCYYAISPTLVKWFGNHKWFKTFWKNSLDNMVSRLNNNGIENTQYQDKY